MTAQVAVLNRYGIALASDSAVTIIGGATPRSYNSADKIFPVVGVPVAVLHSGAASLFSVPWEVLVKQWAKSRGSRQAATIEDYATEFTMWLGQQRKFVSLEAQAGFYRWALRDYLLALRGRIQRELEAQGLDAGFTRSPTPEVAQVVAEVMTQGVQQLTGLDDFDGLGPRQAANWCESMTGDIGQDIDWVFDDVPFSDAGLELARQAAQLLVYKTEPFERDAVLTFAGYGEEDFFPSLFRMTVSGSVAGVVRRYDFSSVTISSGNLVTITPLGLTDAIHGFLRGLSPQYRVAAHDNLDAFRASVSESGIAAEALEAAATHAHEELETAFDTVEWDDFLKPMLDVAETLPMAETVRLADSLVGLAALRQVVRGDTSVGGPVDLARVTRDSGFEWVRKK